MKSFKSFKNLDHRLFCSLLLLGLCPTVYTTIRTFFLGTFPDSSIYSIAGQMEWINLIFEVINEALLLPLFFFIGQKFFNKNELNNMVKTGLLLFGCTYIFITCIIIGCAGPLLKLMAADKTIIKQSTTYIRLECVGNIFNVLFEFSIILLVLVASDWYVYIITGTKLILCVLLDTFITSNLNFSAKLGVWGVAITNIIVNLLLWITAILLLMREGINIFWKTKLNFLWIKEFSTQGLISGFESLIRNIFYMVMILRMVNIASESGTYYVANNFIWCWLIMPATQLGELIKQNVSKDKNSIKKLTLGYFVLTIIIFICAAITIPAWKLFFMNVLNQHNPDKIFSCAIILFIFLFFYIFQNIFDVTFYGLGKMHYMLFETVCTNCSYYVIMFVLYKICVFVPTLQSICWLFVGGQILDTIISLGIYIYFLKKNHLNLLDIECETKINIK